MALVNAIDELKIVIRSTKKTIAQFEYDIANNIGSIPWKKSVLKEDKKCLESMKVRLKNLIA